VAIVVSCALWLGVGAARLSATTIAEYDRLTDSKAKSTLLAGTIVTVTSTLVKELRSPRDAKGQAKTRDTAARDTARAALVPQAVAGKLASSDRIGLLALRISMARSLNPATPLETVVRTWILDQINAYEATPATGAKPR
jgi:hypothetical protein